MSGVLPDYDRCPCCGRPFRYVRMDDPTQQVRNHTEEVVVRDIDPDPLYRRCPFCLARWHRYPEGHRLRGAAQPWVSQWPARGFRDVHGAWSEGVVQVSEGDVGGSRVELRPAAQHGEEDGRADRPFDHPVHVLTGWNPHALPQTLSANLEHHDRLREVLRAHGWHTRPAGAHAPDWQWAERSVAILGVEESDVIEVARYVGQPAFYRWTRGRLVVVSTEPGAEPIHSFAVTVHKVPSRICPMRAVKNAEQEPHVCRNPGGPWISASIHEAARWDHHRQTLLEALGCDVCDGGPADGPGGHAITIGSRLVSSRYGPARYQ